MEEREIINPTNGAGIVLEKNKEGNPKGTIANCREVLTKDPRLKGKIRYNEFSDKIEISDVWWPRYSPSINDTDINNIRLYCESQYGLSSEKGIPRAIDIVAHENAYHPIRETLDKLTWDGFGRIGELFPRYLGAERCEYTTEATKLLLLAAISRIYQPGIKFDTMVCLVDPLQGGGKSTMVRFLTMADKWFSDDIGSLDGDKAFEKIGGHWIIEFSEMLATSNSKSVESIKSFLSRNSDVYRVPYEKFSHDIPRQCIFIGTSNHLEFLPDDKTGNRRFIPLRCDKTKAFVHPLADEEETRAYIKQTWAEAMVIYRQGNFKLTFPEHLGADLEKKQIDYTPEDFRIGQIQAWLDNTPYNTVCSIMIYKEALGHEHDEPKKYDLKDISAIMNNKIIGWIRHPTSDSKVRFKLYGKQRAWIRALSPEINLSPTFSLGDSFVPAVNSEGDVIFS